MQLAVPVGRGGYLHGCGDQIVSERAVPPLQLDPVRESSAAARRYVRAALERFGLPELADMAELGVSELAANVCMHAHTPFVVTVSLTDPSRVRITVSDASVASPAPRPAGPLATSGRGLHLLSAAGDWGVEPPIDGSSGKLIWFEPVNELAEARFADTSVNDLLAGFD
jgi:anti-sigma regulatory factor (Ser/Thr protein kinase)